MAESDRLTSTRDELGLLLDELRSFAANRSAGIHRKCIANLYYAAFHAVRAMLYYHGLDTRTHEGTQRLFAAHFVKPGLMPKAHLRCLATLESDRLRADYQGFHSFDAADVERALDCVPALVTDLPFAPDARRKCIGRGCADGCAGDEQAVVAPALAPGFSHPASRARMQALSAYTACT